MIIDVFIPTYRSDEKLDKLLHRLNMQTIQPRKVYIMHTQAYEGEVQPLPIINGLEIEVEEINKLEFDHGGTRAMAARKSDADIYMFMTQDAVPADNMLIANLIAPYSDNEVAATYARQLSNKGDKLIEKYTRDFNYPDKSRSKSLDDVDELGIKAYFCSNVCATYRSQVYNQLGGFVQKTIFNEDMIFSFKIINNGYKIAYVSEAKVIHSHKYTYRQQFTRNFDLGVSHNQYSDIFDCVKSESEGIRLVKDTAEYLINQKKIYLIPDLILNSGFKYLGYKIGKNYNKLPRKLVIRFSMNKNYWK